MASNKYKIAFCKTGIKELDEILGGGLPEGGSILLAGAAGTGKTILGMEFLFRGARQFNDTGLYLSLSESEDKMRQHICDFDFYEDELVDSGRVGIKEVEHDAWLMGLQPQTVHDVLARIKSAVEEVKAKRVVIDSLTAIGNNLKEEDKIREFLFRLGFELSHMGCTMILISEIPPQQFMYSSFGVEEFISDGIILLNEFERNGDLIRTLQVIKMRGIDHSRNKQVLQITKRGIAIMPLFKSGL